MPRLPFFFRPARGAPRAIRPALALSSTTPYPKLAPVTRRAASIARSTLLLLRNDH